MTMMNGTLTFVNRTCVTVTLNSHCVTSSDLFINICIGVIAILIVVINVMALVTLRRFTDKDDPSNYFLTNLAAADSLTGLFVLYDVVYNVLQFKNYIECVVRVGMFVAVNLASVMNLMTLTMDRYFKITSPYAYMRHVTMTKVKVVEATIWIWSFIIGTLPFFGWSSLDIRQVCNAFGIMTPSFQLFLIGLFTIPLAVMTFAYARLVVLSRGHSKQINALQASHVGSRNIVRTWKSVKTAFIIVGAYFVCWMPVGVFILLVLLTDIRASLPTSPNVIFTYLLGIGVFNSILNPVIYATKIPVFRQRIRVLFCVTRVKRLRQTSIMSVVSLFRGQDSRRVTSASVNADVLELQDAGKSSSTSMNLGHFQQQSSPKKYDDNNCVKID